MLIPKNVQLLVIFLLGDNDGEYSFCFPRFSIDEGRTWSIHNFTSTSVFVDGLLSEPGDETLVMT